MKNPTVTLIFGLFQVVVGILGALGVGVMYMTAHLTRNWPVILVLSVSLLALGLSEVFAYRKAMRPAGKFTVRPAEDEENPQN